VEEPAREVGPLGKQEREVIEAGIATVDEVAWLLDEHEKLASLHSEGDLSAAVSEYVQPDRLTIEGLERSQSEPVR
jgi:hypothetical protein